MEIDGLCDYCSGLAIAMPEGSTPAVGPLDGLATAERVRDAVDSGQLLLLRADAPLEKSIELFREESKYTIVHFLQCTRCQAYIFFGLAIRGWPIYKKAERKQIDRWPWDPSPWAVNNLPTG